jgi:glutathione S-transferase
MDQLKDTTASMLRLYSGPLSMFGAKVQIAMLEKGLDHELVMVPFSMDRLYEPKHPEVLRINPKAQVPVLVHGDLELFDSTQICEYLEDIAPEPPLWPREPDTRARARLLELKSDEVFFPPVIRLMGLQEHLDQPAAHAAQKACARFYQAMERLLEAGEHLAGAYTYADIAFYMAQFFAERMSASMTSTTPRLQRWRERMTARPAVRLVIGPMAAFLKAQGRPVPGFVRELAG